MSRQKASEARTTRLNETRTLKPEPTHTPILSDEDLLLRIQARDETAFAALYDRYAAICLGFMLRILHNRAEAEDVLQEVFTQVWQQASAFDVARGRPATWLLTIARSRALDRLRKLDVRERTITSAVREGVIATANAADEAINLEQTQIVRNALAQIPDKQRSALLLAYFEGLTQTQIAERMGEPLGTIKTRMRNGLMKLNEILREKIKTH